MPTKLSFNAILFVAATLAVLANIAHGQLTCSMPAEVPGGTGHTVIGLPPQNITFYPGDTVTYQCDPGYEMYGSGVITCQNNGTWSVYPTCLKRPSCGEVPTVENGACFLNIFSDYIPNYVGSFIGATADCECDEGYKPASPKSLSIECLSTTNWSHQPSCLVDSGLQCDADLVQLTNGACWSSRDDGATIFDQGEAMQCDCDFGYKLVGSSELVCLPDGIWQQRPTCVEPLPCGSVPPLENGYCSVAYDYGEYLEGDTAECTCHQGYQMPLDAKASIECQHGMWTAPPPCTEIHIPMEAKNVCPILPSVDFGSCQVRGGFTGNDVEGYPFGTLLACACNPGYTLQGSSRSVCRSRTKDWSSKPTCLPN